MVCVNAVWSTNCRFFRFRVRISWLLWFGIWQGISAPGFLRLRSSASVASVRFGYSPNISGNRTGILFSRIWKSGPAIFLRPRGPALGANVRFWADWKQELWLPINLLGWPCLFGFGLPLYILWTIGCFATKARRSVVGTWVRLHVGLRQRMETSNLGMTCSEWPVRDVRKVFGYVRRCSARLPNRLR